MSDRLLFGAIVAMFALMTGHPIIALIIIIIAFC